MQGENFNPEFLKVNPKGTIPALECDGKVYDDSTVSVVSFNLVISVTTALW